MNDPIPHSFCRTNAAVLCRACSEAYDACPSGQTIESLTTDTRAQIYRTDADVFVAFRGTADLRNWLTDLDARFRDGKEGRRIHEGFALALESILEPLHDALFADTLWRKGIWFTGHSLGGALAMLAAHWLKITAPVAGENIKGVYTFGQPRVGNAAFRDAYNGALGDRTFRVIHHEDIVPHVPWLCGAYRHAGHEAWFSQDDPGSLFMDRPAWQYALDDVMTMAGFYLHPKSLTKTVTDHRIGNYLALFPTLPPTEKNERAAAGPPVPGESSQPSPVAGSGASLLAEASGKSLNPVK